MVNSQIDQGAKIEYWQKNHRPGPWWFFFKIHGLYVVWNPEKINSLLRTIKEGAFVSSYIGAKRGCE